MRIRNSDRIEEIIKKIVSGLMRDDANNLLMADKAQVALCAINDLAREVNSINTLIEALEERVTSLETPADKPSKKKW